jgi:hypothetical protein
MASVDSDALLCALILVPRTFSRNRFYALFEDPKAKKIRRRASRIRGIIRQLLGKGRDQAVITGEQVLEDGRVLIRYTIGELSLRRTAALSGLEAAALHYALHRAGAATLSDGDRAIVETALRSLGADLVQS